MAGVRVRWIAIVAVTIVMTGNVRAQDTHNSPTVNRMTTIRAKDIPGGVQILGTFGKPLGSLVTIRGEWTRPGIRAKDQAPAFHVTLVDGKEPDGKIDLDGMLVTPFLSRYEGRGPKPGELWEWRFDWEGTKRAPKWSADEIWEMLGVESGCFESYSDEAWQQVGGCAVQRPHCISGFYTRFEYIAVRRLKPGD
jgi:hypothetical protein